MIPPQQCDTPARLQALAGEFLAEIGAQTVHRPTYDGQLSEPAVLPAQAPNLLINGSSGYRRGHGNQHSLA